MIVKYSSDLRDSSFKALVSTCVLVRLLLRQVRAVPAQQLYLHQLPGGQRRGGGRGRGRGGGGVALPGPGPAHLEI